MKKKTIKEIAFLILTLLISSLVTMGFGLYGKQKNEKIEIRLEALYKSKSQNDSLLDSATPFALLYLELREKEIYKNDFDDFKNDFGNLSNENTNESNEKINFLYNLTKNNSIQNESLEDFGIEYYRKYTVVKVLMNIESFGFKDRTSYVKYLKENPEAVKQMYRKSVQEGYKHSFENFEYLLNLRERTNTLEPIQITDIRNRQKEIDSEIIELKKQKVASETKFRVGIILSIFLIVSRYTILLFLWMKKELNCNQENL